MQARDSKRYSRAAFRDYAPSSASSASSVINEGKVSRAKPSRGVARRVLSPRRDYVSREPHSPASALPSNQQVSPGKSSFFFAASRVESAQTVRRRKTKRGDCDVASCTSTHAVCLLTVKKRPYVVTFVNCFHLIGMSA